MQLARPLTLGKMKTILCTLLLFVGALTASAQVTTNIQVRLIVVDSTGTNQFTLNASATHVLGMISSYQSWQAASTNNTASFPAYCSTNFVQRMQSLQDLGVQAQMAANKLISIGQNLAALYPTMSTNDQQTLATIWQKYAP